MGKVSNFKHSYASGNFLVPFGLHVELYLKKFGWGWTELQAIEQEDLPSLKSKFQVLAKF